MKVLQMSNLVDELIAILKHNQVIYEKAKMQGYNGSAPQYDMERMCLQLVKSDLMEFAGLELSDEHHKKLEDACEFFCLGNLEHGSCKDELYLCTLQENNSNDLFYGMKDSTSDLAAKYDLTINRKLGSDVYGDKFRLLFDELQSEISFGSTTFLRMKLINAANVKNDTEMRELLEHLSKCDTAASLSSSSTSSPSIKLNTPIAHASSSSSSSLSMSNHYKTRPSDNSFSNSFFESGSSTNSDLLKCEGVPQPSLSTSLS